MKILQGRGITGKRAKGPALVTRAPMNFTAAFTKPQYLIIPWLGSQINDRHHELHKKLLQGTALVYPATIGSTGTGMVLMELMANGQGPAAGLPFPRSPATPS